MFMNLLRLVQVELDQEAVGQLAHPGDKVTVAVGDPKVVVDKVQTAGIDESRGDQLELALRRDAIDFAVALERLSLRHRNLKVTEIGDEDLPRIGSETRRRDRHP